MIKHPDSDPDSEKTQWKCENSKGFRKLLTRKKQMQSCVTIYVMHVNSQWRTFLWQLLLVFFLAWRCLIQIFFPDCYQHAYWETLLFFCLLSSHAGIAIHWWGMSPRELRSCCYVKPQSGLSPSLPGCAGLQMPCNWPSPPLLWRTALILASEPTLLQIDFKSD